MRIIVLGYAANLLPGPGVSIALGKGQAGLPMIAGIISMAANLALTLLFVAVVGFYGVPVATSLGLLISTAWFFAAMRRVIAVSPGALLRTSLWWPAVASLPGFFLCLAGGWWLGELPGRVPNLLAAGVFAGVLSLSYVGVIRLTPFLDAFDVDFLDDTLHLGRLPGFRWLTGRVNRA
jgi:peptidoglycan biosynthesis protein MviN/MurJ (putative lipid II flippase)